MNLQAVFNFLIYFNKLIIVFVSYKFKCYFESKLYVNLTSDIIQIYIIHVCLCFRVFYLKLFHSIIHFIGRK